MTSIFSIGGPQFGVEDVKIAAWNGDGTYGAFVDVPSVNQLGIQFNTVNGQLEGDDRITAVAAKIISATVTLNFGSVKPEVIAVLLGRSIESSGSGAALLRKLPIGVDDMKYFGLVGRTDAAEGNGDTHVFIPKIKVVEGFQVNFQYGQFSVPQLTCTALPDENFLDSSNKSLVGYLIEHATAAELTAIPHADV